MTFAVLFLGITNPLFGQSEQEAVADLLDEISPATSKIIATLNRPLGGVSEIRIESGDPFERPDMRLSGLDFFESRVGDALASISRDYDIPITLHESATREARLSANQRLTCEFKRITLGSALQTMLEPFSCTILIKDETVLVVSNNFANSNPMEWAFELKGLTEGTDGEPMSQLENLRRVIMNTVATDSWSENGGSGNISIVDTKLTVSQSYRNLRTIHQLLGQLDTLVREKE